MFRKDRLRPAAYPAEFPRVYYKSSDRIVLSTGRGDTVITAKEALELSEELKQAAVAVRERSGDENK